MYVCVRAALESALRCDYSAKKTDKFSKCGYKILNIFLFLNQSPIVKTLKGKKTIAA